ncbi:T9SS type A sorting domain-containing protein, partial [Rosettibacter firmus]|uniref:T9SS type A sorting domain-containing protein n=1 Tax=Rosettibacter firmus TaxID=3111522 RepID=UPI00336C291F
SPNGGEAWIAGSQQQIRWNSSNVTYIKIEYTTDNGKTWITIINNFIANTGKYDWVVPYVTSTECKVRISDTNDSAVFDISNYTFSVFIYPIINQINTVISFSNSKSEKDYKIFGIPGNSSISLSSLFKNLNYGTDWKAFWDNGEDLEYPNYLIEFDNTSKFLLEPGKAFWVVSKYSIQLDIETKPVSLDNTHSYSIKLHPGWNLISNPFEKVILWDSVKKANNITQPLWAYNGNYYQSNELEPLTGYYYLNNTDLSSLKIPYFSTNQHNISKTNYMNRNLISIIYLLDDLSYRDSLLFFINNNAQHKMDIFDVYAPGINIEEDIVVIDSISSPRLKYLKEIHEPEFNNKIFNLRIFNSNKKTLFIKAKNLSNFKLYLVNENQELPYELEGNFKLPLTSGILNYKILFTRDIKSALNSIISNFSLQQNYPNPFNAITIIKFSVPKSSFVNVTVYDILGREVSVLINEEKSPGIYEVEFNASNLPSGIYFYRMQAGNFSETKKMILLK